MRFWAIVLVVALIAVALVTGGCGTIAKKAVESATGVKVDEDGGSVTIKGDDGAESTINTEDGQLAEDFPDSVPVYDGTVSDSTSFSSGGVSQWTASITTPDSIDDAKAFYAQRLEAEGWKITFDMDSSSGSDRTVAYSAELDNLSLTVTIAAPDGETEIAILVGTKPAS